MQGSMTASRPARVRPVSTEIGARVEFLGHKVAVAPSIVERVRESIGPGGLVSDLFCGTGAVSAALRAAGFTVHANDTLALCENWAEARLRAPRAPRFSGLNFAGPHPYAAVVGHLNALPQRQGFLWQTYSPASRLSAGVERRYLTEANAAQADAVRTQIRAWEPLLTRAERALLLTCLVDAVSRVSNVAGTYGCYLKHWKAKALQPLTLSPLVPGLGRSVGHRVTRGDAAVAAAESDANLLYADPPYTKRQYAAYYHLLETVVLGDEPTTTGSTGLRAWEEHASDWCYRQRAPQALERLVAKSAAPFLLLSYNDDGQIPHGDVLEIMSGYGTVQAVEFPQRRYRSSRLVHRGAVVTERLYLLSR